MAMNDNRPGLYDELERVLRRCCQLSGLDVAPVRGDFTSPNLLELLSDVPADTWARAAAWHLGDIATTCSDVHDILMALRGNDNAQTDIDGGDAHAAIVDDLEFHVFSFPVYFQVIREKMIHEAGPQAWDFLIPSSLGELRPNPAECQSLEDAIRVQTTVPEERVSELAAYLAELERACRHARACIESFASLGDADLPTLGRHLTDVQSALLTLALVLLRADVAADMLLAKW